jgi:hypothetical protein
MKYTKLLYPKALQKYSKIGMEIYHLATLRCMDLETQFLNIFCII